jgi:hypothetical protein
MISTLYGPAVKRAIEIQVAVALFCVFLLDGGRSARLVGIAVLCHWLGVAIIIVRRRHSPTVLDLTLIRLGVFLIMALMMILVPLLGRIA